MFYTTTDPDTIINQLRDAAQKYRDDAADLVSAWQDPNAGEIWRVMAEGLDRTADKMQKVWGK